MLGYFLDLPVQVLQHGGGVLLLPRPDAGPVAAPYTIVLRQGHYPATARGLTPPAHGTEDPAPRPDQPPGSDDDSTGPGRRGGRGRAVASSSRVRDGG